MRYRAVMQMVDEELAGVEVKVAHKVQDEAKDDDLNKQERKVGEDAGKVDGRRAVKGVLFVALNDVAAGNGADELRQLKPAEEEDGEEGGAAAQKESRGVVGDVVKERADNEAHADDDGKLCVERLLVAPEQPELAAGAGEHLAPVADGVVGALQDGARLGLVDRLLKGLGVGVARGGEVALVVGNVGEDALVGVAREERGLELGGRLGAAGLEAVAEAARVDVADGREKVGRGLARGRKEAEIDKILAGVGRGALVQHAARVNDEHLVHELVDALAGLVQRRERGAVRDVGHDAQRPRIVERRRGVEPARRVVPAGDGRLCRERLGNGHALALAARHAAGVLVADVCVLRVGNGKHFEKGVDDEADAAAVGLFRLGAQRKAERLPDGERGQVAVVFRVVDNLAAVATVHLLGVDAAVAHVALDGNVAPAIVGNGLEKGGAAGAGAAEHEHHLAGADDAGKVVNQVADLGPALGEAERRDELGQVAIEIRAKGAEDGLGQGADRHGGQGRALDGEVLEDDTDLLRRLTALRVSLLQVALAHELVELEVLVLALCRLAVGLDVGLPLGFA
ncbi:hypothetical protein CRV24_000298 [Beauveria bassiana]|nr:hypothetical protein CRV24_000298 [Beauveria bassiana]KAH8721177.1 hypothetical protein HC256_001538 [Beauveria bassiana]